MHLERHVGQVLGQLEAAAALGDERTQQVAAGLAGAVAPAVRLAILGALGDAADEVTAALLDAPGTPSVSVRLDGDEVRVDVARSEPQPPPERTDSADTNARISLRLSESLKADIDRAAEDDGVSVNTWLIRAAGAALTLHRVRDGWTGAAASWGAGAWGGPGAPGHRGHHNAHHVTGWIDG